MKGLSFESRGMPCEKIGQYISSILTIVISWQRTYIYGQWRWCLRAKGDACFFSSRPEVASIAVQELCEIPLIVFSGKELRVRPYTAGFRRSSACLVGR
jgi:hypothetical protein